MCLPGLVSVADVARPRHGPLSLSNAEEHSVDARPAGLAHRKGSSSAHGADHACAIETIVKPGEAPLGCG